MKGLTNHLRQLDRFWWLLGMLAGAAVWLRLSETALFGLGMSHDSVNFIAVARNISELSGFISYDDRYVAFWPPLYPILLTLVAHLLNTDVASAARILNLLLYAIVIIQAGFLFRQFCTSRVLALLGCVCLIFAYPLTRITIFAWSELLYLSLSLAVLTFVARYRTEQSVKNLLAGAIFAGLAVITRHIGATLILTFAVVIVFFTQSKLYRKLLHALVLGLVSCLMWFVWAFRTIIHTNTIGGYRGSSNAGPIENISQSLDAISNWLLPGWVIPLPLRASVLIALLVLIALVPLTLGRRDHSGRHATKVHLFYIHGFYVLLYAAFMILVASTVAIDTLTDPRLFAPIVVSFWALVLGAMDFYLQRPSASEGAVSRARVVVYGCFAAWLIIYPIRFSLAQFQEHRQHGAGVYATTSWHQKHIVRLLQAHHNEFIQTNSPVYSNYPDALYILSDIKAKRSPRKHPYRSSTTSIDDFAQFDQAIAQHEGVTLIWVLENYRKYLFEPDELQKKYRLQKLHETADGVIYRVSKL